MVHRCNKGDVMNALMILCLIMAILLVLFIGISGYLSGELKEMKKNYELMCEEHLYQGAKLFTMADNLFISKKKHERATAMITELKKINKSITKRANRLASLLPKECE